MPTSATVRSGATVCASSDNAEVTADQREVLFDAPVQGAGWNILTRAAGGRATFAVSVTANGVTWSNQFKCLSASADQVHMSRPQPAQAAQARKRKL